MIILLKVNLKMLPKKLGMLASIWYDALIVGCPIDMRGMYTAVKVSDGVGAIKALRRHIGSKQTQKDRFDKELSKQGHGPGRVSGHGPGRMLWSTVRAGPGHGTL